MNGRGFVGALALLAWLALPPTAALARTQQHDKELGLSGSLRSAQDVGSTSKDQQATIGASIGYFVTDSLELGYSLFHTSTRTLDQNGNTAAEALVQFHNFFVDDYLYVNRDDTVALYFGPSLGLGLLKAQALDLVVDGAGITGAVHAGLKSFVSEDATVFANLERRTSKLTLSATNSTGDLGDVEGTRNETNLYFGITYFFGRG
jgi:hypothetical protein